MLAAFNAPRSKKHLTEPFAEEFFQVLDKIWQEHPIEIANRLVRGLYLPELEMADAATDEFLREERRVRCAACCWSARITCAAPCA